METINRVELTGHLGATPELRTNSAGTRITTASLAVRNSYQVNEVWHEQTYWFRLVAFGNAADVLGNFSKGERISVQGRLQSNEYTDKEGLKRTSVEMVVLRTEAAPLPRKQDVVAAALPADPVDGELTVIDEEEEIPF
ncbi:single-stranded DNA-binding protein [Candidatus Chloroploca asiatica]|uniref:Single-stranded DNA-binding protein n=1 Tax=Candidatus Chloroploca asiatica TaxID=1506545 RepID=A0A2H3KQ65_9CHLR|nr:single-stranded DNA-binding protein [Candidatus Chloroploca asiatica]PDV97306.1 hypothetical protein A9Q02_18970 [Candidatus Chloroploca asiatica]